MSIQFLVSSERTLSLMSIIDTAIIALIIQLALLMAPGCGILKFEVSPVSKTYDSFKKNRCNPLCSQFFFQQGSFLLIEQLHLSSLYNFLKHPNSTNLINHCMTNVHNFYDNAQTL